MSVSLYYNIQRMLRKVSPGESPRMGRSGADGCEYESLHGPVPFPPWALRKYFEMLTQTVEEEIRLIRLSLLETGGNLEMRIHSYSVHNGCIVRSIILTVPAISGENYYPKLGWSRKKEQISVQSTLSREETAQQQRHVIA